MQMAHHIHAIQEDLAAAASLATDEATVEAGRRLTQALGSSLHLRLLDVVSEAAVALSNSVPGRIEVRLAGRDPELVYVEEEDAEPELTQPGSDDSLSARITLRLPEGLKAQIEVAANIEGASVNTWIVRALQRGLEPRTRSVRTGRRLSGYADS
ncbi:MAG: toxin-antitoxin system HicB family antitoxin [Actinobacteria bacterium]|nr:toxin-antitoxin system HicB family antitoxin [Actinomycetota bacterium]